MSDADRSYTLMLVALFFAIAMVCGTAAYRLSRRGDVREDL